MAIRRWAVRPDETGAVNREDMVAALLDGEALLARAGGVLSVQVVRSETDVPAEMVTVFALLEWKDRTDAKPQPEAAAPPAPEQLAQPEEVPQRWSEEEVQAAARASTSTEPDGFDMSTLEEEDTSSIPEPLR